MRSDRSRASIAERVADWFEDRVDPFAIQPDLSPGSTWHLLWQLLRPIRTVFFILLLLGLSRGLLSAAIVYLAGHLIDVYTMQAGDGRALHHPKMMVALFIFLLVCRLAVTVLNVLLGQQTILNRFAALVRWQCHRIAMGHRIGFFDESHSGALASRVFNSGYVVADLAWTSFQNVWSNFVFTTFTVVMLTVLHWALGAIILAWLAGFTFVAVLFVPVIRRRALAAIDNQSTAFGQFVDTYLHIRTLVAYLKDPLNDEYLKSSTEDCTRGFSGFYRAMSGIRARLSALSTVALTLIAVVTLYLWHSELITIGSVAIAIGLALQLDGQLESTMMSLSQLFRSLGSFQSSMNSIGTPSPAPKAAEPARTFVRRSASISFDQVTFGYSADHPVLRSLSFNLAAGAHVGLVGPSGAGKSTVLSLLMRFYEVDGGCILIDGQDIRGFGLNALRAAISFVPQDSSLLHRSIAENIAIGNPSATLADIRNAAARARALDFIEDLRDDEGRTAFDAHVGQRGAKLSGGQRQRIAIARALLKNAPIFMLDEATSALDSILDADIQESLSEAMKGKTVLAVAHRLSTVLGMHELLVLDDGHVKQRGLPAVLATERGLWAEAWAGGRQ